ncbi:MlaE family ABC transporter permease [Paraburkholderia sp. RL17-373-BIF-A]|uniref:MlaE family ABC transporter permease n=1 Tax=Paraburkholderia sp. RL17-373-BIF-A TaxID=3031629 RepID=UPI0038B7D2D5
MSLSSSQRLDISITGVLAIVGNWTLPHYDTLHALSVHPVAPGAISSLDFSRLGGLDTAGAALLAQALGPERLRSLLHDAAGLDRDRLALLDAVALAVGKVPDQPIVQRRNGVIELPERIGAAVLRLAERILTLVGFIGLVLESLVRAAWRPKRWRITSVVAQLEQTALDPLPIVALLTFMVGAVIAFLGVTMLGDFGASIYTIDLVGFSFLREFGILLASILLAGRTASAFTAQIGSMKANEEIDAMRALGLNPIELLVLPRVFAMVVALPILTFVAMMSGMFGGALGCMLRFGISPTMFVSRLRLDILVQHFFIGMGKAPVFAFLIACIGCLEGLRVEGSAQSVGEHTTSSVVQSIFVVILLDAIAALFFMEMGW